MACNNNNKKNLLKSLILPCIPIRSAAGGAEGSSQHSVLLARDAADWTEIAQRAQRVASRLVSKDL